MAKAGDTRLVLGSIERVDNAEAQIDGLRDRTYGVPRVTLTLDVSNPSISVSGTDTSIPLDLDLAKQLEATIDGVLRLQHFRLWEKAKAAIATWVETSKPEEMQR